MQEIIGAYLRLQIFSVPGKRTQPAQRRPRADAQRNRERILEIAQKAFTRSGANISLDDVAKQAGVGCGNFVLAISDAREALLEAVYRSKQANSQTPLDFCSPTRAAKLY